MYLRHFLFGAAEAVVDVVLLAAHLAEGVGGGVDHGVPNQVRSDAGVADRVVEGEADRAGEANFLVARRSCSAVRRPRNVS